jgi:hypothetical protein
MLLVGLVVCIGCAGAKTGKPTPVYDEAGVGGPFPPPESKPGPKRGDNKPAELIVTPENSLTGKVVRYNDAGRFVVLDFPLGRPPAADQRMFVYRRGLRVGEVKISTWQRENLIVADLTTGEAQEGDEVRNR